MPDIICKDADASVYNIGYDQPWLPALDGTLFGFYMLGTSAPLDVLKDYSGHNRDLTRTGAPVESAASSAVGAFPDGYLAPFTGDDLFTASGGTGFSIFAVIRTTADARATVTGCSDGLVTKHVGFFCDEGQDVSLAVRNGGAGSIFTGVAETPYRGTGFVFVGGLWEPGRIRAFRKVPGGALTANQLISTVPAIVGGTLQFGIGRFGAGATSDGSYADAVDIAAIAYYSKSPSDSEVLSIHAGMQAAVHNCGGLTI